MRNLFGKAWDQWRRIAKRIGHFQSRFLLSLMYFILVGPFALAFTLFADPLRLQRTRGAGHWLRREPSAQDMEEARRQ